MSDTPKPSSDDVEAPEVDAVEETTSEEEASTKLNLDVTVEERGACQRHISVSISREDIERYFDKQFSEMMPTAEVPGFRPGRAPRKLVEKRFRKDVGERVKSELLMDSLAQVNEDEDLAAISEPDLDPDSVELPEEGDMSFEFDLEVRPEFDIPNWKGLSIEKPVREFTDADIDSTLERVLSRRGRLAPSDEPVEEGDYITANLTFEHDGKTLSHAEEEVIRVRPVLSFRDAKLENFGKLVDGATAGKTIKTKIKLSDEAPNETLRGKEVDAKIEVLDVKKLELPELTPELLKELGNFELEADLRDAIKDQLQRQLEYDQRQRGAREQITEALTVAADWDLPPELLERQSHRELERAVMELRRSGFSDEMIAAHENELRQNSMSSTARALKEHFILERIVEDEEIEAEDGDYDTEIALMAMQSGESPRRVRARIEKSGSMDVLRNQIVERKVIDLILEHANFKEVPYETGQTDTSAIAQTAGGHDDKDIPEAKPEAGEPAPGGHPEEAPERE